ncbi:MAG: hypothetical protein PHG97_06720 [Candidatus Margulisbacteria bacterium]|nr:hypothetical protein [Candidatus Margulisiibacteriota bacterium]
MSNRVVFYLPRLEQYSEADLRLANRRAQDLIRRRQTKALKFNPSGDTPTEQAKRVIVMALAAQKKYDHIFTTDGLAASIHSYDEFQRFNQILADYPDPLKTLPGGMQFTLKTGFNSLEIENDLTKLRFNVMQPIHPIGPQDAFKGLIALACAHAQINFMYQWCINLAGDRPRNYQEVYIDRPIGLDSQQVRDAMYPYHTSLSYRSEFFPPILYFAANLLVVKTPSNLPFNIRIPY